MVDAFFFFYIFLTDHVFLCFLRDLDLARLHAHIHIPLGVLGAIVLFRLVFVGD